MLGPFRVDDGSLLTLGAVFLIPFFIFIFLLAYLSSLDLGAGQREVDGVGWIDDGSLLPRCWVSFALMMGLFGHRSETGGWCWICG